MPRFFFHVRKHDGLIRDQEGTELPGAVAALTEAKEAAKGILADKVRRGEVIDGDQFEVCDALGTVLFTLPFKSVLLTDTAPPSQPVPDISG